MIRMAQGHLSEFFFFYWYRFALWGKDMMCSIEDKLEILLWERQNAHFCPDGSSMRPCLDRLRRSFKRAFSSLFITHFLSATSSAFHEHDGSSCLLCLTMRVGRNINHSAAISACKSLSAIFLM